MSTSIQPPANLSTEQIHLLLETSEIMRMQIAGFLHEVRTPLYTIDGAT